MSNINQIKVAQINSGELLSFIQGVLGLSSNTGINNHSLPEIFNALATFTSGLVFTNGMTGSGPVVFQSGLTSNSNVTVNGTISGQTIRTQNLIVPNLTGTTVVFGGMTLSGIPIYDSGQVSTAVTLPSGTIYGLRQYANPQQFDVNTSGDYMPSTGNKTVIIQLCLSVGS